MYVMVISFNPQKISFIKDDGEINLSLTSNFKKAHRYLNKGQCLAAINNDANGVLKDDDHILFCE